MIKATYVELNQTMIIWILNLTPIHISLIPNAMTASLFSWESDHVVPKSFVWGKLLEQYAVEGWPIVSFDNVESMNIQLGWPMYTLACIKYHYEYDS